MSSGDEDVSVTPSGYSSKHSMLGSACSWRSGCGGCATREERGLDGFTEPVLWLVLCVEKQLLELLPTRVRIQGPNSGAGAATPTLPAPVCPDFPLT